MKKILILIMTILLAMSSLVSCGVNTNKGGDTQKFQTLKTVLFDNGKTDYSVLIPSNAQGYTKQASNEFVNLFKEATGITINVIEDSEGLAGDKYISIGDTSLLKKSKIEIDNNKLYRSGYIIKTVGNTIILTGRVEGLSYGSLYAVYGFFNIVFDYEYYAPNCYALTKDIQTQNTPILDEIEIPDISQRSLGYYNVSADSDYVNHLRLESYNSADTWLLTGHSQTDILNPKKMGAEHPDWFSSDLLAVCWSNDEAREYIVEYIKKLISSNSNSDAFIVQIGQADTGSYCRCEECERRRNELYMNTAGQQVAYINTISDEITPWLKENYPNKEIIFTLFAYSYSEVAPCIKDNSGQWQPFSEDVVPRDNVGIYWAPIHMDYSKTIYDETYSLNKVSCDALDAWRSLTDKIYMWSYCTNFMNYMINANNFGTIGANYKYYYEHGVRYIFDQGPVDSGTCTLEELRIYLQAKLMWDTSLNVNELAKDFIYHYYGDAGEEIYSYYVQLNAYYSYLQSQGSFVGTIYSSIGRSDYWPMTLLNNFSSIFDIALKKIDDSKIRNKEEYKNRIYRLYCTVWYLELYYYSSNFTAPQVNEILDKLEKYTSMYNVFNISEGSGISTKFVEWRA